MRTPRIIKGQAFDWEEGARYSKNAVDDEASFADPGCMRCPKCNADYWAEGEYVECLDCGHQWETADGKWQREYRERSSTYQMHNA